VARALQTIQEAYPFLVQSMGFAQDPNSLLPTVPLQLSSQLPWPPTQPSTSHGVAMPQQTADFEQFFLPNSGYPPASPPFPTPALSAPIASGPGESSFQAFTPSQDGAPLDPDVSAEEKRRRNTAASGSFTQLSVSWCHAITQPYNFTQHASESRKSSGRSVWNARSQI
jgi:hypothetical protein